MWLKKNLGFGWIFLYLQWIRRKWPALATRSSHSNIRPILDQISSPDAWRLSRFHAHHIICWDFPIFKIDRKTGITFNLRITLTPIYFRCCAFFRNSWTIFSIEFFLKFYPCWWNTSRRSGGRCLRKVNIESKIPFFKKTLINVPKN